jgi:hypothetical protein
VVLLCSETANFITGQTLFVDGGADTMTPVFPLPILGIKWRSSFDLTARPRRRAVSLCAQHGRDLEVKVL